MCRVANWITFHRESLLFALSSLTLTLVVFYVFFKALNLRKNLLESGYCHIGEQIRNSASRQLQINRARRLRSIGDRIPPPFPNGWFAISESSDVPRAQAKNADFLGHNFLVFRGNDGVIRVTDAYCPHMGANLGVGGVVKDDNCIECPFHRWAFRGDTGECTSIPYSKTTSIPKSAKLRVWRSCEAGGFVFVWHHVDPGVEPWEIPVVPQVENGEWQFHGRNEYFVNCHVQEIPENGADPAHLNAVHEANIVSGSDLRTARSKWPVLGTHSWQANWSLSGTPHIARVDLSHSIVLFNKFTVCSMDIKTQQIGPGYVELLMQTSYGPMVCLQTVTPVEPLVQRVVHRFYSPRILGWLAKFTLVGECIQFERDIMVWNNKKFIDSPILVKEDKQIRAFRTWYGQFYSENSRSFNSAHSNRMDW